MKTEYTHFALKDTCNGDATGRFYAGENSLGAFLWGVDVMQTPGDRIEAFLGRNPHMREITEEQTEGKPLETLEVFAEFMERVEKMPKKRLERLCHFSEVM